MGGAAFPSEATHGQESGWSPEILTLPSQAPRSVCSPQPSCLELGKDCVFIPPVFMIKRCYEGGLLSEVRALRTFIRIVVNLPRHTQYFL